MQSSFAHDEKKIARMQELIEHQVSFETFFHLSKSRWNQLGACNHTKQLIRQELRHHMAWFFREGDKL